jgi:hypothetical protein
MVAYVSEQYYIDLWLEQEGKEPLLEPLSQWLAQFRKDCQDRQTRMQEANKSEIFPLTPLSHPVYFAFSQECRARRTHLDAQHTQCINDRESERARADIAPPWPIPSFEHCTVAFEYMEEYQGQALPSPLVRDVIGFLQRIIKARDCDPVQSRSMEERASLSCYARTGENPPPTLGGATRACS